VPLKNIISNTFENWSMTSAHQVRPIILYTDYEIDVDLVRNKFEELLEAEEDWDRDTPPTVQVVGVTENALELRALCSSKDASTTWDLHCRLREKLIKYICSLENGKHLSKSRIQFENKLPIEQSKSTEDLGKEK